MYVSDLVDGLMKLMNSNYSLPVNLVSFSYFAFLFCLKNAAIKKTINVVVTTSRIVPWHSSTTILCHCVVG